MISKNDTYQKQCKYKINYCEIKIKNDKYLNYIKKKFYLIVKQGFNKKLKFYKKNSFSQNARFKAAQMEGTRLFNVKPVVKVIALIVLRDI